MVLRRHVGSRQPMNAPGRQATHRTALVIYDDDGPCEVVSIECPSDPMAVADPDPWVHLVRTRTVVLRPPRRDHRRPSCQMPREARPRGAGRPKGRRTARDATEGEDGGDAEPGRHAGTARRSKLHRSPEVVRAAARSLNSDSRRSPEMGAAGEAHWRRGTPASRSQPRVGQSLAGSPARGAS